MIEEANVNLLKAEKDALIALIDKALKAGGLEVGPQAVYLSMKLEQAFQPKQVKKDEFKKEAEDALAPEVPQSGCAQ